MTYEFVLPQRRFRVLFEDGQVVDVLAVADSSDMRGWLLKQVGAGAAIVGVTAVPDSVAVPLDGIA